MLSEQVSMDIRSSQPLITVAIPVYNAGHYLRVAVLSIIKQTYENWELLIIDDGSSDGSLESIADIKDSRIVILSDGLNKGLAIRLNEAIDLAKGEYFARMDQDDISYPDRFLMQVTALNLDTSLDLVAVRAITISEENIAIGCFPWKKNHKEICARPWSGFYMPHPTWMGRISWFRSYHYSYDKPYFCEDQELLLRSYATSNFGCVPEILFAYRVRDKTSLIKIFNIRKTILSIQIKIFAKTNQFSYVFAAISKFIIATLRDCYNILLGKKYYPNNKSDLDNSEQIAFLTIFNNLTHESKNGN